MAAQCLQGQSLGGLRTPNAHGGPRLPRQGHMTFGKATPLNPFLCSRCSLCKTCQSPGVSQCAPGTESTVAAAPPEEQAPPGRASLTSSAAMATRQPSGLPPYVEPCSPGLMVSMTSSSHRTADTCKTEVGAQQTSSQTSWSDSQCTGNPKTLEADGKLDVKLL